MTGNSRKVYTAFAETNDGSKVCPTLHFVTTFRHMQQAFFSRVDIYSAKKMFLQLFIASYGLDCLKANGFYGC